MGTRGESVGVVNVLYWAVLIIVLSATATKVLDEYLSSIGGKEAVLAAWENKKGEKKGKKRGRPSTGADGPNGSAKKTKKIGHPAATTPPSSAKAAEFKPPTGSWEEDVVGIDACEGPEGAIVVYLTWKGGQKSQHPTAQVYKRCPQRVSKPRRNICSKSTTFCWLC